MSTWWPRLRKVWAIGGSLALAVWVAWCAIAFQPSALARAALADSAQVRVRATADAWVFEPVTRAANARSLLFFPGGLVDARAYAPLMQAVAQGGHRAVLVRTPWRGAFGQAEAPATLVAAHAITRTLGGPWVVGGHSRGGKAAAAYAQRYPGDVDALVLVGTSHPRDISLRDAPFAVMQVLGDRDPIASLARADRNRHRLPGHTTRRVLHGANHSQFGDYGFQPGDRFAHMPRNAQRAATAAALHTALAGGAPSLSPMDARR
ncbi:alpha/beta fold hydrolase [Luteimonas sp BLCC-B24]|uniref:alpha/beta fold hydrolase n=1 Tax=Luteimonas sp. BLCC-B24 TaxID=3025317 RepID=UPI00234E1683|nr:alpha/beta fold hydrolase [Luteimonas sp. BLCC-B24]MDC7806581.1 alpha/beta fold hydrolase [Luteimonas sp. BLCC-B24]